MRVKKYHKIETESNTCAWSASITTRLAEMDTAETAVNEVLDHLVQRGESVHIQYCKTYQTLHKIGLLDYSGFGETFHLLAEEWVKMLFWQSPFFRTPSLLESVLFLASGTKISQVYLGVFFTHTFIWGKSGRNLYDPYCKAYLVKHIHIKKT